MSSTSRRFVAINKNTGEVIAVGREARDMLGNTRAEAKLSMPSLFHVTASLIAIFISRAASFRM